jgi:hypothetical protein
MLELFSRQPDVLQIAEGIVAAERSFCGMCRDR